MVEGRICQGMIDRLYVVGDCIGLPTDHCIGLRKRARTSSKSAAGNCGVRLRQQGQHAAHVVERLASAVHLRLATARQSLRYTIPSRALQTWPCASSSWRLGLIDSANQTLRSARSAAYVRGPRSASASIVDAAGCDRNAGGTIPPTCYSYEQKQSNGELWKRMHRPGDKLHRHDGRQGLRIAAFIAPANQWRQQNQRAKGADQYAAARDQA